MRDDALRHFLSLPAADRRAIEEQLQPIERQRLAAALERQKHKAAPAPESSPDLRLYSPWLRRRLQTILVEKPACSATSASQEALRQLICERRP